MRTPSQIGQEIADEIERVGHYQGQYDDETSDPPLVCVITAHAFPALTGEIGASFAERNEFLKALSEKVGLGLTSVGPSGYITTYGVWSWNDDTPTEVVLETLRTL